jgi:DNA replication protein DnaC
MAATKSLTANHDLASELVFLTRALKAPTLRDSAARLAERARAEAWSHEEYLAACLQREVAARDAHGGEGRIRTARFPARKSIEEFDFDHARGLKRDLIAHLGSLDSSPARKRDLPRPTRLTLGAAARSAPRRVGLVSRVPAAKPR